MFGLDAAVSAAFWDALQGSCSAAADWAWSCWVLRRFGAQPPVIETADDEAEVVPPLPPLRRGRRQQHQQQAGEGGQRDADASPTTSGSHRSGSAAGSQASGSQASGGSALPRGTMPQPILSMRQAQQAAAIQDLPGIGTWAGRYRLFGRDQPPADQPVAEASQQQQGGAEVQQPDSARKREAEEAYDQFGSPVVLRPGGFDQPAGRRSSGGSYGSEQAREDAWRWRFSRWVLRGVRASALIHQQQWPIACRLRSAAQCWKLA